MYVYMYVCIMYMCMYVCMYVCLYACECVYIFVCVRAHVSIYVCVYVYTCCVCTYTCSHVLCVNVYLYVCMFMCVCICVSVYVCVCICVCSRVYVYMCMYVLVIVMCVSVCSRVRVYWMVPTHTCMHVSVPAWRPVGLSCAWVLFGMYKCDHYSLTCVHICCVPVFARVCMCVSCVCIYAVLSFRVHSSFYFPLACVLIVCDPELCIVLCLSVLCSFPPLILRLPLHVYCIVQFASLHSTSSVALRRFFCLPLCFPTSICTRPVLLPSSVL